MLVHLDTDLGTNPDDLAALAYLLSRPDVSLTGISVVGDDVGRRHALADHALALAGRSDVAVAAPRASVALLAASVQAGATLVGIGPATNLARLEERSPGSLRTARVVLMGGWPMPPAGPGTDHNVQRDAAAATAVHRAAGALTIVPKAVTASALPRTGDLERVALCGPLGALVAEQIRGYVGSGRAYAHNDPLTVAVATGWDGIAIERRVLGDRDADVVAGVDADRFAEHWVRTLEGPGRTSRP